MKMGLLARACALATGCFFTCMTLPSIGALPNSPWPDFGGGNSNSHLSLFRGPVGPVEVLWAFETPGFSPETQPVLNANGDLFFTTMDGMLRSGELYALDANGHLKWRQYTSEFDFKRWPVLTADGKVVVTRGHSFLTIFSVRAYDQQTGSLLWNRNTTFEGVGGGPAIDDAGNIYAALLGNRLVSLDTNGVQRWEAIGTGDTRNCPIALDGTIFGVASRVTAFRPDGSILWTSPILTSGTFNYLTLDHENRFLASASSVFTPRLFSISADGQTINWTRSDIYGAVSVGPDGTVYGYGQGRLHAINAATGIDLWSRVMDEITTAEGVTIDADGRLYLTTRDGFLTALSANGDLLWTYDLAPDLDMRIDPGAPVIGSDGTLYVAGGNTHKVFAFASIVPEPTTELLLVLFGLLAGCSPRTTRWTA